MLAREERDTEALLQTWQHGRPEAPQGAGPGPVPGRRRRGRPARHDLAGLPSAELAQLIQELTDQMKGAAAELHFELAARLRDEIGDLKKELRQMMEAGAEVSEHQSRSR